MGRITICAALVAMLLMLGCAATATATDPPAPGDRIIAGEIRRGRLATCLDHNLGYAERMRRMGVEARTQFAISRCAVLSGDVHLYPIIDIGPSWAPVTADELESCKSIAYADLRSASARVYEYSATRRFYALSVCIPKLGTS